MTTPLTEQSLAVFWEGEEVDGLLAYGLWSEDLAVEPMFPAELWPANTQWKRWRLHGEGWVVSVWTIRIAAWPDADNWEATLGRTLQCFIDSNAVVAWFGIEGLFADRPSLFDPNEMSGGVYAALTRDEEFLCMAHIGAPFQTLSDEQLMHLRDLAMSALAAP